MTPEQREHLKKLAAFDIEPKGETWRSVAQQLLDEIERLEVDLAHAQINEEQVRDVAMQLREQLAALEAEVAHYKEMLARMAEMESTR